MEPSYGKWVCPIYINKAYNIATIILIDVIVANRLSSVLEKKKAEAENSLNIPIGNMVEACRKVGICSYYSLISSYHLLGT